MKRTNVTLAIDEDLLMEARVIAARKRTSVSELIRRHLEFLVEGERDRIAAWNGIRSLVENPAARLGGKLPARQEIHDRQS